MSENSSAVLGAPEWLLTGFDAERRAFTFVETEESLLLSSGFIDGRTPLSRSERVASVAWERAVEWLEAGEHAEPDRFIFHVGFCGSTLLARTLDATKAFISFREPQVLVELSSLKASRHPISLDASDWRHTVRFVTSQFRKPWGGRVRVVKPTNWTANIAADLCEPDARAVLMSTEPSEYLVALLRGGNDRISFLFKFVQHLGRDIPEVARLARLVIEQASGWQRVFQMGMIALSAQEGVFERLRKPLPQRQSVTIEARDLIESAEDVVGTVAMTFDRKLESNLIEDAVKEAFGAYSKQPWVSFDARAQAQAREHAFNVFGLEIERACAWRLEHARDL